MALTRFVAVAGLVSLTCITPALAQDWPTRPVTMVVPFAAGGPADTVGRILAPGLSELLGQQIVIENVGGSGGMTGAARVAKAAPDGYQFVLGNMGTHAANQTFYKTPLYNSASDFTPVMLVAQTPLVLLARKDLPADNLRDFIAYAKAVPTISETVPGYEAVVWYGIVAPKGTPPETVNILNAAVNAVLADPKLKARLAELGGVPMPMTPADFGEFIVRETEKWGKVVKFSGAKPD